MASRTAVRRPFAGQERTFDLRIGEIMALERACEAGIFGIVHRLASHHGRLADIRETIRLGLMGGSDMSDAEATRLVMDAVDGRPLSEALPLAAEILNAVINGLPEPEQQEDDGRGKGLAESRTPAGSPPTTGTAS